MKKDKKLVLPENSEQIKNLILGCDWELAKTLAQTEHNFLHAFALALRDSLCPIINEMFALLANIRRGGTLILNYKCEAFLLYQMRVYLCVYTTDDGRHCEVSLPCQVNGLRYEKYTFQFDFYPELELEKEVFTRFTKETKDKKPMVSLWRDEFDKYLPYGSKDK